MTLNIRGNSYRLKDKLKAGKQNANPYIRPGDIVIVQDADLEYDPSELPLVIRPILEGHADVVFGSRFLVRRATRVLYFYHYIANKFLTFTSNLFTNLNMTDIETGYKAFRGDIIRNMVIVSSGFGFEIEATAKVAKLGCAIYEVPISYYGRTYDEGKKIGWRDGVRALYADAGLERVEVAWPMAPRGRSSTSRSPSLRRQRRRSVDRIDEVRQVIGDARRTGDGVCQLPVRGLHFPDLLAALRDARHIVRAQRVGGLGAQGRDHARVTP